MYSCFVLARASSAGVGPVFASRAISSVTTFSISASEAPGRAVAMTANQPEISARVLERLDRRAELPVVDERLVQARGETVGQDQGGQVELGVARGEDLGGDGQAM